MGEIKRRLLVIATMICQKKNLLWCYGQRQRRVQWDDIISELPFLFLHVPAFSQSMAKYRTIAIGGLETRTERQIYNIQWDSVRQ